MPKKTKILYLQTLESEWIEWRYAGRTQSRVDRASVNLHGIEIRFTLPDPHPTFGKAVLVRRFFGTGWRVSPSVSSNAFSDWRVTKTLAGAKRAAKSLAIKQTAEIRPYPADSAHAFFLQARSQLVADRRRTA